MKRRCYALVLCLISLIWIGCGEDENVPPGDVGSDSETILNPELVENRNKWQSKGIRDYEFSFQWSCFCTEELVAPVNVSIVDGAIDTIVSAGDGLSLDSSRFKDYRSVDGLFDFIQKAFDRKAHSIIVTYDAEFGYPKRADIDYNEFTIDEERGFNFGDFVVR